MTGKSGNLPSLRRHYPDQVLRVLSQPSDNYPSAPRESVDLPFKEVLCKDKRKRILFICNILQTCFVSLQTTGMKSFCLSLLAGFAMLCAYSQKNIKDANAVKRTVGAFHSIKTADGIDLYLTQGNEEGVAVSASKEEYRNRIVTKVENGVLHLYYEKNGVDRFWSNNRKLKAYISFRQLNELQASGGADVNVDGTLKADKLVLRISGGSDVQARLDCGSLNLEASGGSDVQLSGKVGKLELTASGGSDFSGYELAAENAEINVSGGSDVTITVNKELTAQASGGSDLNYRGNAVVVKTSSSGGGSVHKRG